MRFALLLIMVGLMACSEANEAPVKRIALTFDDAPREDGAMFTGEERGRRLIEELAKANSGPVAFFVTTGHFDLDDARERIANYASAGHLIANHSHSHSWLHKMDAADYLADIDLAESLLDGFDNRRAWFRFPYLDEGRELEKRDAVRAALQQRGLMNGYVTVDNYDWHIAMRWKQAVDAEHEVDIDALRSVYVDTLMTAVRFYDQLANEALDASPAQVLLLHENDVAAMFIGDLIGALRAEGWTIISPDKAYEDEIATAIPETLLTGQGRVAALAVDAGTDNRTLTHLGIEEDQIDALLEERSVFRSSAEVAADAHAMSGKKLVIAHRGASGYLPEHTIAAKAMAYAQGADYIEQDLVMTRDDEIIVLHDHHLDTVSNVAALYPGRHREDGRYYVIDFDLDEIRQLSVYERFNIEDGVITPVFEGRFPYGKSAFRIHTFAEEIELIQGLNESTGELAGIYPEIKSPAFHREEGKDISTAVLTVLRDYGYVRKDDAVYLQCFDADELQRIHSTLMPEFDMNVKLVQLLGTEKEYRWMLSEEGMQKVSSYADGVGPSAGLLISKDSTAAEIIPTRFVRYAHAAGLQVHPYTFRRERNQIPPFAKDYDDLLRIAFDVLDVDGVFTDFPDLTVKYLTAANDEPVH